MLRATLMLLLVLAACSRTATGPAPTASPLTRQQMISRVLAHAPVFACPSWSDWFSVTKSEGAACPVALDTVKSIRGGRANLAHGGFIPLKEYPTEKK